ncbi:MAG TPA: radical SAM family heme chaperone HemW [Candidatus Tyrphobacter sp.]
MPLGIYVHLAFCPYLCPYCDFAKWPYRESAARRYLDALVAEIDREAAKPAATIFLGGGTPNAHAAATLSGLIAGLCARFPAPAGAEQEITIELNPELVHPGDCEVYRGAGVTRLSIGAQSFDEREVRMLGRRHRAAEVELAIRRAREARIGSVSLDLMFAVPEQTLQSWRASLEHAIALDVDHVSAYGLTIEAGTPYAELREREPRRFPGDEAEAEMYEIAIDVLGAAGYEQYEISNFARPGHRCAHNENYWSNGEYLGFGVGAASYRGGERSTHTRLLDRYIDAALSGVPIPGESERLEGARRAGEAIMLALRTAQGVRLHAFKERYGIDMLESYGPVIAEYGQLGLLERGEDAVRLTRRGRFLANDVCGAFLSFA